MESVASLHRPPDTVHDAVDGPRLDEGTQLVGLRWWPDAGEAVAFVVGGPSRRDELADLEAERATLLSESNVLRQERDHDNRVRAARRARSRLRRYVVANGLTRMASLTFAPTKAVKLERPEAKPRTNELEGRTDAGTQPDAATSLPGSLVTSHQADRDGRCVACGRPYGDAGPVWAMRQAAEFMRRLRASLGVESLPYALVPEWHKDGHVHLHVLLDRYVPKQQLSRLWGHGFVDVRRFAGSGGREAARKAAAYASKYVGKAFERLAVSRRHRYEVGQGYQPAVVKRAGYRSLDAAIGFVLDHGQAVTFAVSSDGLEDYDGPPFLWVALETYA